MLVCFDATVLCGAIRKPTGYNFKLLELAAGGAVLSGFTTDVAGMEFVRNALEGLSGVTYDMAGEFDAYDLHLVAAAVARDADMICTANRVHLPEGPLAGGIEIIGPGRLAAALGVA
jgi:hypothetical protein